MHTRTIDGLNVPLATARYSCSSNTDATRPRKGMDYQSRDGIILGDTLTVITVRNACHLPLE